MTHTHFDRASLDDPRWAQRDACGVGFIASIHGHPTHKIVQDGLEILRRLDHRGGRAADKQTSDGAGVLIQIPRPLFKKIARDQGLELAEPGSYAVGMIFLPEAAAERTYWLGEMMKAAERFQLVQVLSRPVPVDSSVLGPLARSCEPFALQIVLVQKDGDSTASFSWRLLLFRKILEELARQRYGLKQQDFYIVSLSTETICYKGLILSKDLPRYYLDLQDPLCTSAFAMVHQRFSTNTLPAWPLAQPFRSMCHNGEINTLRGNLNAMHARSRLFTTAASGWDEQRKSELKDLGPICAPSGSDSAMLDNTIEFLLETGRPLTQVLSMLIPEPWEQHQSMDPRLKDYYEYHSYRMEPWDGPAFIGFSHGKQLGAILDRNGLRPGRYWITEDGYVIMASEAGVLDRRPEEILQKGRLSPGRIFLVDMEKGQVVPDQTIKQELAAQYNYGEWLAQHRHFLQDLPFVAPDLGEEAKPQVDLDCALLAFGYSKEDLRLILAPMANEGKEPLGSMGNDTPIAALSHERPLLYNYFKQLFAQVTNPPIDAIREELVTSLETHLGRETNLLRVELEPDHVLRLKQPILTDADLQRIELYEAPGLKAERLQTLYSPALESLEAGVARITAAAVEAVNKGASILILSDRGMSRELAPVPALLITAATHHRLIEAGSRTCCSLVVESGEPREVHHFASLIGYGAAAINPYLALEAIAKRDESYGFRQDKAASALLSSYIKAIGEGLLKVMSKMGISTVQSYRGSQIFEALGLSRTFVDSYFCWTPSRIEGIGIDDIDEDVRHRHALAFAEKSPRTFRVLPQGGFYHWRREGERHLHNPQMIASLQKSTRINSKEEFKAFCTTLDREAREALNIRGLLRIRQDQTPVPLEEVEVASSIVKRFATGAMSFGSISKEAHETLAVAMNRIGAKSNSGEGGEDEERFLPTANGDLKRSAIKQVASARFGVTSHYLINADELQIKMAQGAKPGEGGQLPGHKVDEEIARVRHSTPGITLISPPPHHDIYSIEDLAQLIFDLKNANPKARVSVKLVSEMGVGTVAAGVAKAKADAILISGYEGGTGASPLSSIKHAGLPWELGLVEAHKMLVDNQLRARTVLQVDGQLRTPRDIAIAALLGAEEWGIGTGALIVLGCIMMRKCHLNTCPVGVATQDPELRKKFQGQPEHLINYFFLLAEGLREIMASLGFRSVQEMVGRVDLLEKDTTVSSGRAAKIDLSCILTPPRLPFRAEREVQDHELSSTLDAQRLIPACETALSRRSPVRIELPIRNTDRAVGTMLSSEISRRWGAQGLRKGDIHLHFRGAAGQSFMAFGAKGIIASLEGEVNDYCGKGLSGAQLIITPPEESPFLPENNVICGNVSLYGATSGSLYVRGLAGERFAVRNSGAHAVVEGVGDHACEYMTGGSVIVLGQVGRNFAAGMSGGYAYIYDSDGTAASRINSELVKVESLWEEEDLAFVLQQVQEHQLLTRSRVAAHIIDHWAREKLRFIAIIPMAYREMMRQQKDQWMGQSVRAVGIDDCETILQQGGFHG